MSYSTEANVKQEAGFAGNSNVDSATVTRHISSADSRIDAVLSKHYTLPLTETPPLIEQISRLLSAGYLMLEEYGTEAEGTSKDGSAKVREGEAILKQINEGTIQVIGSDGAEISTSSRVGLDGFPNSSTGTDRTLVKDDPPNFEVGQTF